MSELINVAIPTGVHERLKDHCKTNGLVMRVLVARLIENFLKGKK